MGDLAVSAGRGREKVIHLQGQITMQLTSSRAMNDAGEAKLGPIPTGIMRPITVPCLSIRIRPVSPSEFDRR